MAGRIATISGTMLVPGVSRNRRLYSRELIAKAAARMSERIADPAGLPIVMRTHHEAGDNSQLIVGRLTGVKVGEDGAARYTADLYDTAPGRDIAALVAPGKGQPPALRSVSIHGYWLGPVKSVQYEGESVSTGDDLEIDALDFTATPGVLGATVDTASLIPASPSAEESTAGRTPISESVDATVTAISETAPPIRTKAALRRAIREAATDTARATLTQRAQALGLTALIPSTWKDGGSMAETTRYSDVREYYPDGPTGSAGFCIDAYNGPTSITIRNCSLDPAELRVVAKAAMDAIVSALQAVDPDMDADVDVDGAPVADSDDDTGSAGESALPAAGQPPTREHIAGIEAAAESGQLTPGQVITPAVVTEALTLTETTLPDPGEAAPTTEEEAAMGEPTTTQETAAPARSFTDADIAALGALFGTVMKESLAPVLAAVAEKAPAQAATATESATVPADAPAVAEAKAAKKAAKAALKESLKAEIRDELRAEILKENGLPPRQGYRVHENDKAAEPSDSDLFEDRASLLLGALGIPAAPQTAQ